MNEVDAALADAKAAYEADEMPAAIERFTTLAEQGLAEACQQLGFIFKTEEKFLDPERSQLWYGKYLFLLRRAAENGDASALLSLGQHYQYGELVGTNYNKARSLFLRAAQMGHEEAQFHLANLFLHGWCGCPQDDDQYVEWLSRAADAQHPEALFTKGTRLRAAGVEDEGLALIRRSAELGFWVAQEYLESNA